MSKSETLKEKVPTPNHDIDWCKFSKSSMFKKLDDEILEIKLTFSSRKTQGEW